MQYIVQVPSAKRICTELHERDIYEELFIEVRALVGDSELADECTDYMLHSLMCDHLDIRPEIVIDMDQMLGPLRAALVRNRCIQFYFEQSSIDWFLQASTHAREFRHSVTGVCLRHTDNAMLVQECAPVNDEGRLWQI